MLAGPLCYIPRTLRRNMEVLICEVKRKKSVGFPISESPLTVRPLLLEIDRIARVGTTRSARDN